MIRFKDFLLESNEEELDELIAAIKKCKKNLELVAAKKQIPAWRGDESEHQTVKFPDSDGVSYLVRGPRSAPRKSLAGSDAAMAYVTNNWADMPRRAYSNFGTFNRKFADDTFNNACWIIPFDNVKQFATSPTDFNLSSDEESSKRTAHQLLHTLKSFVSFGPFGRVLGVTEEPGPISIAVSKLADKYEKYFTLFRHDNSLSDALDDPQRQPAALEFLQRLMEFEPKLTALAAKLKMPPGDTPDERVQRAIINREKILAQKIEDYMGQVAHATHGNINEFFDTHLTPKVFGITVVNGYAALPRYTKTDSEFWFEGGYLSIDGYDPNYLDADECVRFAVEMLNLLKAKK